VNRWLLLLAFVLLAVRVTRALRSARRPSGGTEAHAEPWDPHAVLGVPPGAPRDAITRAYHEQLKRYHPDRVADLGTDLQRLAHEKTLALRRAYDELTRQGA
jgi:DnaJ-domain-containing protein 1